MVPRYTRPAMTALWSERATYERWLKVELAACEAMEAEGSVPAGTAAAVAPRVTIDPERVRAIEETTRHDVIAFLTHVEEQAGEPARWLHLGLTSSDVLDTALALAMVEATDLVLAGLDRLRAAVRDGAHRHARTVCIGRSHGIHAEPTTLGLVLALWYDELGRARRRLTAARETVAVGKCSGAVGTFANVSPSVEERTMAALRLRPAPASNQIVQRDRHAELLSAYAICAASVEKIALAFRHWQRTEVGEVEEPFGKGQKGSSAMPHKRNPVLAENLCGLARTVRGLASVALENVALWHERDISHSSAERFVLPDASATLEFMLHRAAGLVEGMVVHPDRMLANLERTGGLIYSQRVLLELARRGLPRQRAYELVQRHALAAAADPRGASFQERLAADQELAQHLGAADIDACFALAPHLAHVDTIFRRVFGAAEGGHAQ
jgi:adenylosuccinate lyase